MERACQSGHMHTHAHTKRWRVNGVDRGQSKQQCRPTTKTNAAPLLGSEFLQYQQSREIIQFRCPSTGNKWLRQTISFSIPVEILSDQEKQSWRVSLFSPAHLTACTIKYILGEKLLTFYFFLTFTFSNFYIMPFTFSHLIYKNYKSVSFKTSSYTARRNPFCHLYCIKWIRLATRVEFFICCNICHSETAVVIF